MDIKSLDRASDIMYEIERIREELNHIKEYNFILSTDRFSAEPKYHDRINKISFRFMSPYINGLKNRLKDLQKEFCEL